MSREYINPPTLFSHPNYTRVLTVERPSKLIFIAGQTPADQNYQALFPGICEPNILPFWTVSRCN